MADITSPVANLFVGDMGSEEDDTGDPRVVFHRHASVQAIAADLRSLGPTFFVGLLTAHGHAPDKWLYQPLLEFFDAAAANNSAIAILWDY
ncbi:hypothetical protein ACSFA8_26765 [Variovorax sp. RT4R15]|uniref:hypothetical protein n=1 Tax=Variovorax sp. RT4R15 TaxID=3443737 RepID=UPI003F473941